MSALVYALFPFLTGLILGSLWREIVELKKRLGVPKRKSGVTNPAYKRVTEIYPEKPHVGKTSGIVVPKTPKRLEWEAEQERIKASEKWGIGEPKK